MMGLDDDGIRCDGFRQAFDFCKKVFAVPWDHDSMSDFCRPETVWKCA